MAIKTVDCLVYSHNENGIEAAVAAALKGLDVGIVGGHDGFGGMLGSGGLVGGDFNRAPVGVVKDWYQRAGAPYGLSGTTSGSPTNNRAAFQGQLDAADVAVTAGDIGDITHENGRLTSVITTLGDELRLSASGYAIDASYGSDLLVRCGVSTTFGREAQSALEPLAGFGVVAERHTQSPLKSGGGLMNHILPFPGGRRRGSADDVVQGCNFRLVLMKISDGGVPFTEGGPPPDYDPANYEWYNKRLKQSGTYVPPTTKTYRELGGGNVNLPLYYDLNDEDIPPPAYPGGAGLDRRGWIVGTLDQRAAIRTKAMNWLKGRMYFFATSTDVWDPRREWFASMGYAPGEFPNADNYPTQIYIRTGRRLLKPLWLMTQADTQDNPHDKDDVIVLCNGSLDRHVAEMYANAPNGRADGVIYEGKLGDIHIEAMTATDWHFPWRSLVSTDGLVNVISGGFCNGETSIAQSAGRMTGQTMHKAQAAGIGVWKMITTGKTPSQVGEDVAAEVALLAA